MIERYESTTFDGSRFFFNDVEKAKRFALMNNGEYVGLVVFKSVEKFMAAIEGEGN